MRTRITAVFLAAAVMAITASAAGQKAATGGEKPLPYTSPTSGAEMYGEYCASCHGKEGKGDGPAAAALKAHPPDLTTLAKKNGGKFPGGEMYQVIKWGGRISGHGSKDMPVWGRSFLTVSGRSEQQVDQRIRSLLTYIESLQVK